MPITPTQIPRQTRHRMAKYHFPPDEVTEATRLLTNGSDISHGSYDSEQSARTAGNRLAALVNEQVGTMYQTTAYPTGDQSRDSKGHFPKGTKFTGALRAEERKTRTKSASNDQ